MFSLIFFSGSEEIEWVITQSLHSVHGSSQGPSIIRDSCITTYLVNLVFSIETQTKVIKVNSIGPF